MGGRLVGAAAKAAIGTAAMSMTFGAAAASVALAGAYVTNRTYHNTLGRNGTMRLHDWRVPGTQKNLAVSPKFTRTFTNTLVGGGLVGGTGMGVNDAVNNRRWNLERALSTGAVEVQRPDFMGASGSLTLASRRRRGGVAPAHAGVLNQHNLHMAHLADDVAMAMF